MMKMIDWYFEKVVDEIGDDSLDESEMIYIKQVFAFGFLFGLDYGNDTLNKIRAKISYELDEIRQQKVKK